MQNKKKISVSFIDMIPYLSIVILLVVWSVASLSNSEILPSPVAVIKRAAELFVTPIMDKNIFGHIWASLQRVLIAMFFATIIGVLLGVMIGWSRRLRLTVGTLFEVIRPIPPIAWLPLIVMLYGIGEFPKVLLVFIGALMPIVVNTYTGIKMVDQKVIDMAKVFNATNKQILMEIVIPASVPAIIAGVKNGLGVGWMVVLAAEMIGADSGVGFLITRGSDYYDVALILVGMVSIGVVGALISVVVDKIEKVVCPWNLKKSD